MARAETHESRQLLDVNPRRYVSFDVRANSSGLPRREAASHRARFALGQSMPAAGTEAWQTLKQRQGVRHVRSSCFRIPVARSACCFNKLSRNN
jgi:hypothetical protein